MDLGGSPVMWAGEEQDCVPFYQERLFEENPAQNTQHSVRYRPEHVLCGGHILHRDTQMTFFKSSEHSVIHGSLTILILINSFSFMNVK